MPNSFQRSAEAVDKFVKELEHQNMRYVRFELPDLHGISRCKVVPIQNVAGFARQGLNFYGGTLALDTGSRVVPGARYHEEVKFRDQLLYPDLETVTPVPWHEGTAKVICDTEWGPGEPLRAAPRHVLRQVLEKADDMGYKVMMAHEFEFYVLEAETMEPLFGGLFIFNNVRNQWAPFIEELLNHVQAMGIDVITHNCEYAPSQFEINYRPAFGLVGADKGFTFKNAVKEFVQRAGYHATFMSKPWPDRAGSGCHVHVSLWDRNSDENAFVDLKDNLGLSNLAKSFIQGQLAHGRAMMALLNPTPNCYHRVKPRSFAPSNISWGIEDRTAMIRVKATRDDRTHAENRLASAMANPYLSAAATLAAGLLGIDAKLALRAESAGLAEDDASWPNLPRNLEESLDALAEDDAFRAMLGEEFFEVFNAVKRFELACFHSHVTDWERNEYLEIY